MAASMGKLNVYDMADKGVNTSKSPIHLEDGELTKAQNFQTDPTLADGCIRRRDGMSKLNSSALAGSVKGLIALPLPDEFASSLTFYAPFDDATTNSWRISTTGAAASWSTITTSTLRKAQTAIHDPGASSVFSGPYRGLSTWGALNHKIYFPGDDYNTSGEVGTDTPPTLYSFDGTTVVKLLTVSPTPGVLASLATGISSIVPYSSTELLIGVFGYNSSTTKTHASLLLYDIVTGALEQLGAGTDLIHQAIHAPFVYQGRIWVAPMYSNVDGITNTIKWLRPGDAVWTDDASFHAANIGGTNMVEFQGDLYMGTHSATASVATIRKRTAATAVWSTVKSTDGSGTGQYIGPLIKTADNLTILAYYNTGNGTGPLIRILASTDGTTWTTDLDVVADLGAGYTVSGIPYLDTITGSIYWHLRQDDNDGFIKRRTSAGVWSTVDTFDDARGPILPLKVVA